jgi:hypothetical protein
MGLAGICLFIFAVKKDYFRNLEDVKYRVFWSDLEELVDGSMEQKTYPLNRRYPQQSNGSVRRRNAPERFLPQRTGF